MKRDLLLQGSRVNKPAHGRDAIRWNAYPARMLPNAVLIRRKINAVHLVLGDIAVQPLNLRSHFFQNFQGMNRQVPDLVFGQRSSTSYFALDNKLRHGYQSLTQEIFETEPRRHWVA